MVKPLWILLIICKYSLEVAKVIKTPKYLPASNLVLLLMAINKLLIKYK